MTTNSTGIVCIFVTVNMNLCTSLCTQQNFWRGRIVKTNCIFDNTPPPHFGLDVVYKMLGGGGGGGGGVLTGDYGTTLGKLHAAQSTWVCNHVDPWISVSNGKMYF